MAVCCSTCAEQQNEFVVRDVDFSPQPCLLLPRFPLSSLPVRLALPAAALLQLLLLLPPTPNPLLVLLRLHWCCF